MPPYLMEHVFSRLAGDVDDIWDAKAIAPAKERAKSLLRAQVVDFVNWLKAQGAI